MKGIKRMIKFNIRNESDPKGKEFKGALYLEQRGNGDVDLIMVDVGGATWNIIRLETNGTIIRYEDLPDNIGLQVDEDGRIILSEEE